MKREDTKKKETFPPGVGRDLSSTSVPKALNQKDANLENRRHVSGSGNREGGFDMHPHRGDHGQAQKQGSPKEADYYGNEIGFPGPGRKRG